MPLLTEDGKPGPNQLPERYSRPETSGLTARVVDDDNRLDFDLRK